MDFDFNEEQYMFQETFHSYLGAEFPLEKFVSMVETSTTEKSLHEGLNELGLFALLVPEQYGGLGLGFIDLALILEEMGKALVPPPFVDTLIASSLLSSFGTEEQKDRLLSDIAEGKISIVAAIQEKDCGYGIDNISCEIVTTAQGKQLGGSKFMVPMAATVDFFLIIARDKESSQIVTVLLERDRAGIDIRANSTLDPSSRYAELSFDEVVINESDLLVDSLAGESARKLFDLNAMSGSLQLTGIASRLLDISVEYSTQRVQFDKPIGSFQAIKHKCADMAVAVDASRSAAYYAAWAMEENSFDCARAVSIAKSYCADAAELVCAHGLQIHGGMGFTWELGLHHYLRRARVLQHTFGDASFHRERVIANTLAHMSTVE